MPPKAAKKKAFKSEKKGFYESWQLNLNIFHSQNHWKSEENLFSCHKLVKKFACGALRKLFMNKTNLFLENGSKIYVLQNRKTFKKSHLKPPNAAEKMH